MWPTIFSEKKESKLCSMKKFCMSISLEKSAKRVELIYGNRIVL